MALVKKVKKFFTGSNSKAKQVPGHDHGILIAIVGRTGSGMSQFIHDATGDYPNGVAPDATMSPFTTAIHQVQTTIERISPTRDITLIDTPGFDYSRRNDEHTVFESLDKWFVDRYHGSKLDGVIYMHNISTTEAAGKYALKECAPLRRLCGDGWKRKVIFVNTHWEEAGPEAGNRELQLRGGYWSDMLSQGSRMVRYDKPGDNGRAIEILQLVAG